MLTAFSRFHLRKSVFYVKTCSPFSTWTLFSQQIHAFVFIHLYCCLHHSFNTSLFSLAASGLLHHSLDNILHLWINSSTWVWMLMLCLSCNGILHPFSSLLSSYFQSFQLTLTASSVKRLAEQLNTAQITVSQWFADCWTFQACFTATCWLWSDGSSSCCSTVMSQWSPCHPSKFNHRKWATAGFQAGLFSLYYFPLTAISARTVTLA